jgi:hypothetical protein
MDTKNKQSAGSLISLDMIGMLISDMNREIHYKLTENQLLNSDLKPLSLNSDGDNHLILFLGDILWSSQIEKNFENIPLREELTLNERKNFEKHLRLLINDRILQIKNLEM